MLLKHIAKIILCLFYDLNYRLIDHLCNLRINWMLLNMNILYMYQNSNTSYFGYKSWIWFKSKYWMVNVLAICAALNCETSFIFQQNIFSTEFNINFLSIFCLTKTWTQLTENVTNPKMLTFPFPISLSLCHLWMSCIVMNCVLSFFFNT